MNKDIVSTILNSGGRFFGLHLKDGRAFNAQLVRETPKSIRFRDRNFGVDFIVRKTSICSVRSGGQTVH